ncbi:MAG: hypothetical protein AB9873_16590 [Syntrophobacteraceae bacterium]
MRARRRDTASEKGDDSTGQAQALVWIPRSRFQLVTAVPFRQMANPDDDLFKNYHF